MATKGKDNIIDGQMAFEFLAEMEVIKPEKKKRVIKEKKEPVKPARMVKYKPKKEKVVKVEPKKKKHNRIKPTHLKKNRRVRRILARVYGKTTKIKSKI